MQMLLSWSTPSSELIHSKEMYSIDSIRWPGYFMSAHGSGHGAAAGRSARRSREAFASCVSRARGAPLVIFCNTC